MIRPGERIPARSLVRLAERTFRLGRSIVGGMLGQASVEAPRLFASPHEEFPAKLSGAANPYTFTEVYGTPGNSWAVVPTGRTGTCYERNGVTGLNNKFVEVSRDTADAWRFTFRRKGTSSCTNSLCANILDCTLAAGLQGATVTVTQGGVTVGTCVTDASGDCCVPINSASGTYTVSYTATGYQSQSQTVTVSSCSDVTVNFHAPVITGARVRFRVQGCDKASVGAGGCGVTSGTVTYTGPVSGSLTCDSDGFTPIVTLPLGTYTWHGSAPNYDDTPNQTLILNATSCTVSNVTVAIYVSTGRFCLDHCQDLIPASLSITPSGAFMCVPADNGHTLSATFDGEASGQYQWTTKRVGQPNYRIAITLDPGLGHSSCTAKSVTVDAGPGSCAASDGSDTLSGTIACPVTFTLTHYFNGNPQYAYQVSQ